MFIYCKHQKTTLLYTPVSNCSKEQRIYFRTTQPKNLLGKNWKDLLMAERWGYLLKALPSHAGKMKMLKSTDVCATISRLISPTFLLLKFDFTIQEKIEHQISSGFMGVSHSYLYFDENIHFWSPNLSFFLSHIFVCQTTFIIILGLFALSIINHSCLQFHFRFANNTWQAFHF